MTSPRRLVPPVAAILACAAAFGVAARQADQGTARVPEIDRRTATVTNTPGFVALWDFVTREPGGSGRHVARVPGRTGNDFALEAGNYVRDYWGEGREAN